MPGHDRGNDENTMNSAVHRTATYSYNRLIRRYKDRIDYEHVLIEIRSYLKANGTQEHTDHYRAAERAFRRYGSVGSAEYTLTLVLFYWMAVNDNSPGIQSSVEDRKKLFVDALYECQRGNNLVDGASRNAAEFNAVDDGDRVDRVICSNGVRNKFAQQFTGFHPDVFVLADINERSFDLIKGFVAELLLQKYRVFEAITSEHILQLNLDELEQVKQKINRCYYDIGLEGDERAYINNCLRVDALQYLELPKTKAEFMKCIENARHELEDAPSMPQMTGFYSTMPPSIERIRLIENIIEPEITHADIGHQAWWEIGMGNQFERQIELRNLLFRERNQAADNQERATRRQQVRF